MGWIQINWKTYKHSKRASVVSWIAGRLPLVWLIPWLVGGWLLSEYTEINDLLCMVIALIPSVVIVGGSMMVLEKLAEKWGREDTIEYYRRHPQEYLELVKRIEAEKNSDLKKFY